MILMSPDYLEKGLHELRSRGCEIIAVVPVELKCLPNNDLEVRYYQIVHTHAKEPQCPLS